MAQPRVTFIQCLYLVKFNLHVVLCIGYIAQMVERMYDDLEIAWQCCFEPAVRHYFSSSNVRLLTFVFTGGDPQSDWLKRNEQSILVSDKILIFSVLVSCLRGKGPALWNDMYKAVKGQSIRPIVPSMIAGSYWRRQSAITIPLASASTC